MGKEGGSGGWREERKDGNFEPGERIVVAATAASLLINIMVSRDRQAMICFLCQPLLSAVKHLRDR